MKTLGCDTAVMIPLRSERPIRRLRTACAEAGSTDGWAVGQVGLGLVRLLLVSFGGEGSLVIAASATPRPATAVTSMRTWPHVTTSPTTAGRSSRASTSPLTDWTSGCSSVTPRASPALVRRTVPRTTTRPSASRAIGGRPRSSSMSPTTSSNRSPIVTTPAVPPCSSITTAMWARARRIAASTASSGVVVGTCGSGCASRVVTRRAGHDVAQQRLDVDAAGNVIEVPGIDRVARVRRDADDLLHGVDRRAGRESRPGGRGAPSPRPRSGCRTRTARAGCAPIRRAAARPRGSPR